MALVDQWRRLVFASAEHERQDGIAERDGVVRKVWAKNGEQKVRICIGIDANGNDVLTPWLHCENHRGPHRHEAKYRKGQSVKVSTVGGDFRQAKITPAGENQDHQRPRHANDYDETEMYAHLRGTYGNDYQEEWLSKKLQKQQTQQTTGTTQTSTASDTQTIKEEEKDDVSKAIALIRFGKRPKDRKDKGEAWDGPEVVDGDPQPTITIWAKNVSSSTGGAPQAGESSDPAPPDVETQEVHIQFGKLAKSVITEGKVVHSVGDLDDKGELINAATAAITTILGDKITHQVTTQSITTILQNLITHQVGNSITTIMPSFIKHLSDRVDVKALSTLFTSSDGILHLHGLPIKVLPMILHPKDYTNPAGQTGMHPFREEDPDPTYITASMSGPSPPSDPENGVPFNGIRWTDTTSGIEYSYYDGTWSENGGRVAFPAAPEIGDLFDFEGRQWKWNGVGWESTQTERITALDEAGSDGQIIVGQTNARAAYKAVSNDATLDKDGVLTLADKITAGGPIGDATHVAQITFDAKGRLTAVSSVAISFPPPPDSAEDLTNGVTGSGKVVLQDAPTLRPAASATPANNGDLIIQATSNTQLTFKLKGSDGIVRSGTLTLAQ